MGMTTGNEDEKPSIDSGLMQLARLSFAGEMPENLPDAWLVRQARITGATTEAELEETLAETADRVNSIFDRYYGANA